MLRLKVNLVEPVRETEVRELFHDSMLYMEEPFMNSVPMVHSLLMRKARNMGVKVVLNGHGADELFAGYPTLYHAPAAVDYVLRGDLFATFRQISGMCEMLGISALDAIKLTLDQILPYRLAVWNHFKNRSEPSRQVFRRLPNAALQSSRIQKGRSRLDSALRGDFSKNILPSWLHLEDRISMSQSIEARLPFLDYRLVEFAFRIDQKLKIERGRTKRILRQAMAQSLPDVIVREKKKFYFSGPDAVWLDGALKPTVRKILFDRTPAIGDFLMIDNLREEFEEFWNGRRDRVKFLWTAFATEYWLQHHC
jgi:asparagine synthase (glutamine-hydrolysing)